MVHIHSSSALTSGSSRSKARKLLLAPASGPRIFPERRRALAANVNDPAGFDVSSVQLQDATAAYYGFVSEDVNAEFFNKAAARQATDQKYFRQHEYDWFGQDTWKVRHNLTLTLGSRYQLDGVPFEENGSFSNLLKSRFRPAADDVKCWAGHWQATLQPGLFQH